MMMEEPSSSLQDPHDMDSDPPPGFTASGQKVTQETSGFSSRGLPVTQETGIPEASAPRHAIEKRTSTGQSEPSNDNNVVESECFPNKRKRPPATETSCEDRQALPCEDVTKTQENNATLCEIPANVDADNENGNTHDPERFLEKDTGNDQKCTKENNNLIKEDLQSHSQTEDTDVDQLNPASKTSFKKGDQLSQVQNTPASVGHKRKCNLGFLLLVLRGLSLPVCIYNSTVFVYPPAKDWLKTVLSDLSPGDVVAISRWWKPYYHFTVYVGDGYIVHLTCTCDKHDWCNCKKATKKKEKLADIIGPSDYLRKENGTLEGKEPSPREEILKRANSDIGKEYNLLSYNCEHFAHWCRYGVPVSKQADNLVYILKLEALKSSGSLMADVIMGVISGEI